MITLHPFDPETNYSELCSWWTGHNVPCIPKLVLPRGWMASGSGLNIAASFLYVADGKLAMIEWTTTNPKCCWSKDMLMSVKSLWAHLESVAAAERCVAMMSMVRPGSGEQRLMGKLGYINPSDDKGHLMYIKALVHD